MNEDGSTTEQRRGLGFFVFANSEDQARGGAVYKQSLSVSIRKNSTIPVNSAELSRGKESIAS